MRCPYSNRLLLHVVLLLILCNLMRSLPRNQHEQENDEGQRQQVWKNAYSIDQSSSQKCSRLCDNNLDCKMWVFRNNQKCFILSNQISKTILEEYQDQLIQRIQENGLQFGFSKFPIQTNRLVGNALPFNSQTLYNHVQHFSYHCKYTISIWAWLWKGPLKRDKGVDRSEEVDRAIFSTRPISDIYDDEKGYLPSILFNLQVDRDYNMQQDSLFFSANRDVNGDYSGFRPKGAYVRYNEWMHIMMSIDNGKIYAFLDGKLLGTVQADLGPNLIINNSYCPYLYSENSRNNNLKNVLQPGGAELKSNTIMQVFGSRPTHDITTAGIVQDFLVIRNYAVKDSKTATAIMKKRRPETPYTLVLLLRSLGIYALDGFTPLDFSNNPFIMKEWNLCPVSVCGEICIDPRFLLGFEVDYEEYNGDEPFRCIENTSIKNVQFKTYYSSTLIGNHFHKLLGILPRSPTLSPEENVLKGAIEVGEAITVVSHRLFLTAATWLFKDNDLSKKNNHKKFGFDRGISNISSGWRERRLSAKRAWSALSLALWLLDDSFVPEYDMDIPWTFPYGSESSQEILKALAFVHGVESSPIRESVQAAPNSRFEQYMYSELSERDEFKCYNRMIDFMDMMAVSANDGMDLNISLSCKSLEIQNIAPDIFDFISLIENGNNAHGECHRENATSNQCRDLFSQRSASEAYYYEPLFNKVGKLKPVNIADLNRNMRRNVRLNFILGTIADYNIDDRSLDQYLSSGSKNQPHSDIETNTMAAASLLFPITQYVASHYGSNNFGISIPERLLLSNGQVNIHADKVGSDLFDIFYHDANLGDVEAIKYMGRRYFWGLSGEPVHHESARKWFQMAADKDDPEGLYNIGVMHLHGQGGFIPNVNSAFYYLNRSAHGASVRIPFLDAIHALGNLYNTPEYEEYYNEKKAKDMFKRAAMMDCRYGHFSYAVMLKQENNVADAIAHLCRAGSLGNVRAINYLAHALYDQESWFYHTSALYNKSSAKSDYNKTAFAMFIGNKYVEIPWPVSAQDQPVKVALILLRYVSTFIKSVDEGLKTAYESIGNSKYLEAIEQFDSVMMLGDARGTQNSIYILEAMRDQICPFCSTAFSKDLSVNNLLSDAYDNGGGGFIDTVINFIYNRFEAPTSKHKIDLSTKIFGSLFDSEQDCNNYFDRNLIARYIIALKAGDDSVLMELADRIADKRYSFDLYFSKYMVPTLTHLAFLNGEVELIATNAWNIYHGNYHYFEKNSSLSRFLFRQISSLEKKIATYLDDVLVIRNTSETMKEEEFVADNYAIGFTSWDLMVSFSIITTYAYDFLYALLGISYVSTLLSREFLVVVFKDYVVRYCLTLLTLIFIVDTFMFE